MENAFAQAVEVSQNLTGALEAFKHLSTWAGTDGPVVRNLILTTVHIRDIANEQVQVRLTLLSGHVPGQFRIVPGRMERGAAGPSW